jgi:hypothetical protein
MISRKQAVCSEHRAQPFEYGIRMKQVHSSLCAGVDVLRAEVLPVTVMLFADNYYLFKYAQGSAREGRSPGTRQDASGGSQAHCLPPMSQGDP